MRRLTHIFPYKSMICLILVAFPSPLLAQTHQDRFSLGFNVSGTGFSDMQGSSPVVSTEIVGRWEFMEKSAIEVALAMAEFRQDFDTPVGPNSISVLSWWAEAGWSQQLLRLSNSTGIHGGLRVGITTMHRPETSVDLGALGTATVPSAIDTRAHIGSDIKLAQKLFESVTMNLGVDLRLLSPFSEPETGYSVFGGFSIEVP